MKKPLWNKYSQTLKETEIKIKEQKSQRIKNYKIYSFQMNQNTRKTQ